jgi:glycosyltransferase involved in cell wall biosynthesis
MNGLSSCTGAKKPVLSVVIGSHNSRASIKDCLEALQRQQDGIGAEIIVVDNSTDGADDFIARDFPDVTLMRLPSACFIPELWEAGIRICTGEVVALTTAHCVPASNWMREILKAHEDQAYVGIGGAIENDDSAGLVDWAVYFCRYSPYIRPFLPHVVQDIPADNASYKKWALDRCEHVRQRGFWEPDIHAELKKHGLQLLMLSTIVVRHKRSFSFAGFMTQRFWHGRQFGRARVTRLSILRWYLYIVLSPLIPLAFLYRITRRVTAKKRHLKQLVLSSPILLLFLLSWSVGELSGYLWKPQPS